PTWRKKRRPAGLPAGPGPDDSIPKTSAARNLFRAALTFLFREGRSAHAEGVPHVAVKIGHRVLGFAVLADLKVEMGPCGHAGFPHGTDHLPGPDGVALLHREVPALAVEGRETVPVVDDHIIAPLHV